MGDAQDRQLGECPLRPTRNRGARGTASLLVCATASLLVCASLNPHRSDASELHRDAHGQRLITCKLAIVPIELVGDRQQVSENGWSTTEPDVALAVRDDDRVLFLVRPSAAPLHAHNMNKSQVNHKSYATLVHHLPAVDRLYHDYRRATCWPFAARSSTTASTCAAILYGR